MPVPSPRKQDEEKREREKRACPRHDPVSGRMIYPTVTALFSSLMAEAKDG